MFSFSALLAVAGATELQYAGEDLEKSTSWKAPNFEFSDSLWPKEATYYIVIVHILAFLPAWLCSDKHTHCLYTPCYFHSLFLVPVVTGWEPWCLSINVQCLHVCSVLGKTPTIYTIQCTCYSPPPPSQLVCSGIFKLDCLLSGASFNSDKRKDNVLTAAISFIGKSQGLNA